MSSSIPADVEEQTQTRFGFASLIGPSNSGKSTLLNRLVGTKVAIVTPKTQTTRCRIAGIVMYANTQVAYLDTPGIFPTKGRLDRAMVKSAWGSGNDADTVSVLLDTAEMFHVAKREKLNSLYLSRMAHNVLEGVARKCRRGSIAQFCICANKMDAIPPARHAQVVSDLHRVLTSEYFSDEDNEKLTIFPMSARDGDGVSDFTSWILERMPVGPWMYPDDDLTDMPARLIASEVTREKIFMFLRDELPYEIAVETKSYKQNEKDGSVRIEQDIYVIRESQKRIVTGQGASMVKKIGIASRMELSQMLDTTVHLMLTVKVRGKWKDDKRQYDQWGLDYMA